VVQSQGSRTTRDSGSPAHDQYSGGNRAWGALESLSNTRACSLVSQKTRRPPPQVGCPCHRSQLPFGGFGPGRNASHGIVWVNVSPSGYGIFTSGATELENLLDGLIQNTSGNLTGNLAGVTYQLATLGLSQNVLRALASPALQNGGEYGFPLYQKPASGGGESWQEFGLALFNAVSGVITNPVGTLSAVWSATIAAAEWFANAASALSDDLGITWLVDQTAHALQEFGEAMWWAFEHLLEFAIWLVNFTLSLFTNPIKAENSAYFGVVNTAYLAGFSTVSGGGSITGPEASSLWQALSGSEAIAILAIGGVIAGVLTIVESLSIGIGTLVGIAISLIVLSAARYLPAGLNAASLIGNGATGQTFVDGAQSALVRLDPSQSGLATQWKTWAGFFSLLLAGSALATIAAGVITAGILGWSLYCAVGFWGWTSLVFAFFSLLADGYYFQTGETATGIFVYSQIAGVIAAAAGGAGVRFKLNSVQQDTALVGTLIGAAGVVIPWT
jgi:hypothetical protein